MSGEVRDTLRRALAEEAATAVPRPDCPPPEEIWAAVAGELPADRTAAVVDHLAECAVCEEAWELAVDAGAGEREERREKGSTAGGAVRRWLPLAATVLLALAVALFWPRPEPEVMRGGEEKVSVVVPESALPREEFVLRWHGPADGEYRLRLIWELPGEDRLLAAAEGAPELRWQVPSAALAEVPGGTILLWELELWREGRREFFSAYPVQLR